MTYGRKPYSTQFRARGVARRYLLSGIPPTLWTRAQAKAKREGVSMRALLLGLVEGWLKEPDGHNPVDEAVIAHADDEAAWEAPVSVPAVKRP